VKMWKIVCRIRSPYGNREIIAGYVSNYNEAVKMAQVLQEGADSNPKSNATFTVEPAE